MKVIRIAGFIILTFTFLNVKSQEIKIKEGAYRNIVDFHKNKPFVENVDFHFKEKAKEHIYSVSAKNKKFKNSNLNFEVWAIFQDSTLFINLKRLGMGNGYAKILELGRYSFFIGRIALTADQKDRMNKSSFDFGLIGWAVSAYNIRKENGGNDLYLMDLQKGMPENLTINYMKFILRDDKDLFNKYMMESEKASLDVMIGYIKELNSRVPLY